MIKGIAINLPQFHPINENDKWWGKGFTEWTNVTKARPLFRNHYQPHLPADLGFYDLRLEEARIAQSELARAYGIYGFCYYHYWFNGHRLLNRPLDDMLKTKTPDFPFMLCWANENWTRRWDGLEHEILIRQNYSTVDHRAHINFLIENFFLDSRYIKVNDKPFFTVYRPDLIPDLEDAVYIWREEAGKRNIELYLGYAHTTASRINPVACGFDCGFEFHPDFSNSPTQKFGSFKDKILHKLKLKQSVYSQNRILSYKDYIMRHSSGKKHSASDFKMYPGITPMWDNTARKKRNGYLFFDSSPEAYKSWLQDIVNEFLPYSPEENFLFINAWNEWAEGNHLEPCQRWGRRYLQATAEVLLHT